MRPTANESPILSLTDIRKSFGTVQALKGVDFQVQAGQVLILLGENGAGKSTLLKIITGVHSPDSGTLLWEGRPVTFTSPAEARAAGIRMVYQELNLAPHLTVAENISLGSEAQNGPLLDHRAIRGRAVRVLEENHFALNPDTRVGDLGPAQRQLVEIARALAADARLLLLDEPTSSLGEQEIESLFATLRRLKAKGLGTVYVSHRLPECFAIGDRVVVLRDGAKGYEAPLSATDTATVVRQMVGRSLSDYYPRQTPELGRVRLNVQRLSVRGSITDLQFTARAGEVVGIAGLMGAGRSTLLAALFGMRAATGSVTLDEKPLPLGKGPAAAIRSGVGLVTEDRKRNGLALNLSVQYNMTLAALKKVAAGTLIRHHAERNAAQQLIEQLNIKTASAEAPVGTLSGGNQQKAVFARWLFAGASLLLLDEPTRGVDVGSKVEIYQMINTITERGGTVLLVSSELPELLGMSDRVIVLHRHRLTAELSRLEATPERVSHFAMTGTDISPEAAAP